MSPFLAQSPQSPWDFFSDESNKDVFGFVNEVTLEPHLARGPNLEIRGSELSVPSTSLWGGERDWSWYQLPIANELVDLANIMPKGELLLVNVEIREIHSA